MIIQNNSEAGVVEYKAQGTYGFRYNVSLVRRLIDSQFSQFQDLAIKSVAVSGWNNRTFHLG